MIRQIDVHKYVGVGYQGDDYDVGNFAQNLHKGFRWAVTPSDDPDYKKNPWKVDYGRATPMLTVVVQSLLDKVDALQKRIDKLEKS